MEFDENKLLESIARFIEPDGICVDIGANVGLYTDFFLRQLKGKGKVYSVELLPATCEILMSKFGHWPNFNIINCAANDFDGETEFFYGEDVSTHNIIGHDMNYRKNKSAGKIRSLKMDTLLLNEPKINFVKIDVEGAENNVLRGMLETLKKVDYILIENHLDELWEDTKKILIDENEFILYEATEMKEIGRKEKRVYQAICINKNKKNDGSTIQDNF
jgi:FkbM family methyltransferase